jgi:hypothetical protein
LAPAPQDTSGCLATGTALLTDPPVASLGNGTGNHEELP